MADSAINGLNTLMDIRIDGNDVISDRKGRACCIQQIGVSDGVKELRIIRGQAVDAEYGPGLPEEAAVDEMDTAVLASGKAQYAMRDDASLRAVLPFVAMKEFRTSKCLRCHAVDEGAVLGAATITV